MKCSITADDYNPCPAMDELLPAEANTNKKGFDLVHVCNFETGENRFLGITYRAKANSGGILLNVCPFCEGRLGEVEWGGVK